jgi:hypothetical protein
VLKKISVIFIALFLFSFLVNANAEDFKYIEIFSIDKEKVVKVVQSNPEIQKLIQKYIQGMEGICVKFDPIPSSGHAVKIPLDPPITIKNKSLDTVADVVIIMIPKDEKPFLMIFEDQDKLVCYTFRGNINMLWKVLDYNVSESN